MAAASAVAEQAAAAIAAFFARAAQHRYRT